MTLIFSAAFIASLAYCASPSVINAEGIRRGLHYGFRSSIIFQVGALAVDTLLTIIVLSGLAALTLSVEVQRLLNIGGGVLIIGMALGFVRDAWRESASPGQSKRETDLLHGAIISITNPFVVLFWLTFGGGLLVIDVSASPLLTAAIVIGAFLFANVIWSVLIAALATYGRTIFRPTAFRWINAGAGVCLALFGVGVCWQTVATLVPFLA